MIQMTAGGQLKRNMCQHCNELAAAAQLGWASPGTLELLLLLPQLFPQLRVGFRHLTLSPPAFHQDNVRGWSCD